jgi:hypothetical protein
MPKPILPMSLNDSETVMKSTVCQPEFDLNPGAHIRKFNNLVLIDSGLAREGISRLKA